jgi:hypothetical protein
MSDTRSASQILFGYLPEQTVDLRGGIWKVREWRQPIRESSVDLGTLRRELRRLVAPWRAAQRDGGYAADLDRNRELVVMRLDRTNGVDLEPFPKVWLCKSCRRILSSVEQKCQCGHERRPGQLQFVGTCSECGTIKAPFIPRCPQHQQVRVTFPGTSSASEIDFSCPICSTQLRKGFGFARCDCGQGSLQFNVHRASTVYTPRSVVIVNPPTPERLQALMTAGGPPRALAWVMGGMRGRTMADVPLTREALRQQLVAQNVPQVAIDAMLNAAEASGALQSEGGDIELPPERLPEAQGQAVTIALASAESRLRVTDLTDATDPMSEIGILYRDKYPLVVEACGLEAVELCDRFPVLTGMFGYTRGSGTPGASRLTAFRERNGTYRVYADLAQTEALFFRLSPQRVISWLRSRGFVIAEADDDAAARAAIIRACEVPDSDGSGGNAAGSALLTLIHSYAHRFIRLSAVHAGIDRNALSELLVPLHLGFYIYAAARGDFVLGGLQAVFESDLDRLLGDFVQGEHRCALDPGCRSSGGACMACLHIGEPSCRYFNQYLDRNAVSGTEGYLHPQLPT